MNVYFIGDPHLGQHNIHKYRTFVNSCKDNNNQFKKHWNSTIKKDDLVFFLGDVALDYTSLNLIGNLSGRKILIKGNNDDFILSNTQLQVFEEIQGFIKYKNYWLSHCPIHPNEMRNLTGNIHGHTHHTCILKNGLFGKKPDNRYINVCVDYIYPLYNNWFISLDHIRKLYK